MADSEDALLLQRRARRRLVGAIALVVLTVIVLPIVFDKEKPPERQDLVLQIPSQDAGRFNSRVLAPEAAPKAEPAPAAPPAKPEPAAPPAKPEPAAEAPKAAPAESRERFVVLLGAYSDRNLKQLEAKISTAGYRSFTEKVPNKAGQLRLRAGPFPTRAAADAATEKLKTQGFADAVVRQEP